MNKRSMHALAIFLPFLVTACSTVEPQVAPEKKSEPVTVIRKAEIDAVIAKQWSTTNKDVFKKSAFSEKKLNYTFEKFAMLRLIADMRNKPSGRLGNCQTIELLEIKTLPSPGADGASEELWEVDLCSVRKTVPVSRPLNEW